MKITLGTVQFGIQYGISNTHGVPSDIELKSIFSVASQHGIQQLDTASAYGNAEERIGKLSSSSFDIITKFPSVNSSKALEDVLNESLHNLEINVIYGYLAHNADVLIQNPSLWEVLLQSKTDGKIKKIGYSLYTPDQLEKLLDLDCIPDLVQLPYSVLDRKFEKQLNILKEIGTEVHVRSVFLQGLYFMNPNELPVKLKPLESSLIAFNEICKEAGVTVGEVALNYVISNPKIDKIVIGVETVKQLKENIDVVTNWKPNSDLFSKIEAIHIQDKSLLNPVNW